MREATGAVGRPGRCLVLGLLLILACGVTHGQDPATAEAAEDITSAVQNAEADLAELQALRERWRAEDEARAASRQKVVDNVLLLETRLADAQPGSAQVETIFDRVKPMVAAALGSMRAVLREAREPFELRQLARRSGGEGARLGGARPSGIQSEAAQRLEQLDAEERELAAEMARQEVDRRLRAVMDELDVAGHIWQLRIASLKALPPERKREVHSLAGEGLDELKVELEALRVVFDVQILRLRGAWELTTKGLIGFLSALRLGTLAVKLLIVFLLWRWAQANRNRYLRRARERVASIQQPQQRERALRGIDFLAAMSPWGIFLLALWAAQWVLGERVIRLPGVGPSLLILSVYGIYRLLSDVALGLLTDAMSRAGTDLPERLDRRLGRRARWVIRVGMIGLVLCWWVDLRIGRGLLYAHLVQLTWLVVALVFFLVMGGLREPIADLFLASRARGPMANLVRRTRDGLAGRLVAPVALLWLIATSVLNLLKGVLFSLESTRAASAYVARRRVQKSAETGGYATGRLEDLPPELIERLDCTIRREDLETLDLYSGMDECRRSVALWRDGEAGGSFLLAGDEGLGKRAWVDRFVELEDVQLRIAPSHRILNGDALVRWLSAELLGESEALSADELTRRINEGEPRIVVLECAELLFLTTVNGYHGLAQLGPIVDETRYKLFWLVSMRGLAYRHLSAARKDLAFLRRQHWLGSWSEERITSLIEGRLSGSGVRLDYSSLVSEGRWLEDHETRNRQGRAAYANLLSDFCNGNPKVALYYFLRSLEPAANGELRVRPFQAPDEKELELIDESALFILAAVARHGSLTPHEAALATNYPVGRVQGRLVRLHDLCVVDAEDGAYGVTTEWRASVLRVLRRHNILVS